MTATVATSPRATGDDDGLTGLEQRGAVRRASWRLMWLLVAVGVLVLVLLVSIAVGLAVRSRWGACSTPCSTRATATTSTW